MEWYENFGLDSNPFEANILKANTEIAGFEKEKKEALYRVMSGSMILVEGPQGSGKTGILKYIIGNFRGKIIYFNGKTLNKALDIEAMLIRRNGMMGRIFKKKPKGMILLLDNVDSLSVKNSKKIKYYFDQDYLKSVVFTVEDAEKLKLDESIMDRIDKRVIKLRRPSAKQIREMLEARIGDKNILDADTIEYLAENSENPWIALKSADLAAKYMFDNEKDSIEKSKLKDILLKESKDVDESEKEDSEASVQCIKCGESLVNVGEYWRCENCEKFCKKCGAEYDEEDETCPECGGKLD